MLSLLASGFSYLVVINAYLLRLVLIFCARKLRFTNLTEETNWIMLAIFYMNVFNYGFVYLWAPWDSRNVNIPVVQSFFGGVYTDYNAFWFNDVGAMVCSTMLANMYYPALEFFGYWGLRWLYRAID